MKIQVQVSVPIWIEVDEEEYKKHLKIFEYIDNFEQYIYSKYFEKFSKDKPEPKIINCYNTNDNSWGENHGSLEDCLIAMENKINNK